MEDEISCDQVTRFLSSETKTGKYLWLMVKPFQRKIEFLKGVLIPNDFIEEKPCTNEMTSSVGISIIQKGIRSKAPTHVSCLYQK